MTKPKEKDGDTKYVVNRRASGWFILCNALELTLFTADTARPAYSCQLQRPTNSTQHRHPAQLERRRAPRRWQRPRPQSRKCERLSLGLPPHPPSQWSHGRSLHPIRRVVSVPAGLESETRGCIGAQNCGAGVQQGLRNRVLEQGYVCHAINGGDHGSSMEPG